jgi:hypothetical protein
MRISAVKSLDSIKEEFRDVVKARYYRIYNGLHPDVDKSIFTDCAVGSVIFRMNAGLTHATLLDQGLRLSQELGETHTVIRDFYNVDHFNISIGDALEIRNQQALDARSYWLRKNQLLSLIELKQSLREIQEIDYSFPVNFL